MMMPGITRRRKLMTEKTYDDECNPNAWWDNRSLPMKILMVIGFAILGLGLLFLFGYVVMLLWNWLMPDLFGLKRLGYWQAWGLLLLFTILFKGMGSNHGSDHSDRKRRRHLRQYMQEAQSSGEDVPKDSAIN
jgi:hypothetical protein